MRTVLRFLVVTLAGCLALAGSSWGAEDLMIAAGAGYKHMLDDACAAFTAQTGIQVSKVYGNMGQIIAQAKEGGNFDFVIGDKHHLENKGLVFSGEYILGKGKLVAVVPKGSSIQSLDDLTSPTVKRVAMPDSTKAIYGHAATEYLQHKGLLEKLQPKLLVVGTVPQVSAYVLSGEVDLGFINMTDALVIAPKIGKIIPVNEQLYSPILIVAERLKESPHAQASAAFIAFWQSDMGKAVAKKYGL